MDTINKRSSNFNPSEVSLLNSLVKKYWRVLEKKKADAATRRQKSLCWERLAEEFNARSASPRSSAVLRGKWENNKKQLRKKLIADKKWLLRRDSRLTQQELEFKELLNIRATETEVHPNHETESGSENMVVPEGTKDMSSPGIPEELGTLPEDCFNPSNRLENCDIKVEYIEESASPSYEIDDSSEWAKGNPLSGAETNQTWKDVAQAKLSVLKLKAIQIEENRRYQKEEHECRMKLMMQEDKRKEREMALKEEKHKREMEILELNNKIM